MTRQLEGGRQVPLILFPAYGTPVEHQQKAAEVGADVLLSKPILPDELLAEIKRLKKS